MDRVAIVTGAGSGIGAKVAARLGDSGHGVVCGDIDGDAAQRTAATIPHASPVQVDVRNEAQCQAMADKAMAQYGRLDVAVNAAGIEVGAPATEMDVDLFRRVIDVNLTGSFLVAKCAANVMVEQGAGGRIVLIGSLNSVAALPNNAAYVASKGGVLMLGRALALDLASHRILVNVVGPGPTNTPMSAATLADPDKREELLRNIPLQRPAEPEEMAGVVAYLASEECTYITGAFIPVDGGWLAHL